ncbi:MurR/RpiR family transcriptional regulator [Falsirhodobacter sp. alg1]|uniref:MurR/RpiR family transcriptional regulator n=1 Tax=Falsirhodobacter sp. alg1 TaxID=1472418 RepID=UPI000787406A|nr:MurR/RpiR family transcriptional regulator [Falsirhodobacter sp. alg1]
MADKSAGNTQTVAERLRSYRSVMTTAELAIASELMGNYPVSGLLPIVQLAAKAGVSAPTVTRLITKLGYSGYSAFHDALRQEVQARMFSPLDVYPEEEKADTDPVSRAASSYIASITSTFQHIDNRDVKAAVAALADPARNVSLMGGRYSHVLARHLGAYLSLLRTGVSVVPADSGGRIGSLVDLGDRSVVVVYDFRRYQQVSVDWGVAALKRGAFLIVVTDQYLSPLSSQADALLTANTAGVEPFDSMTGAFAVTEMLISEVARSIGTNARDRLADYERLQIKEEDPRIRRRP